MTANLVSAVDALSDLPECVLHHIMSLLSEQDVSRIAVVSKWLNHIWVTSLITIIESPFSEVGRNYHSRLIDLALSRQISRLDKRRFCTSIGLQKLRVHAMFCCHDYNAKINHLVSLALDNRVEEIDFCHTECRDYIHAYGKLWGDSFSGRSVRVIKIENFDLQAWDLDSVTAQTEELILHSCRGFKTIHINKDSSLKVVDIQNCALLETISVDSSASLQSLTLHGNIKDVILKDCRSLKDLTLQLVHMNDASLAHILSQCPVLEALTLTRCRYVQTMSFHGPTLKKIVVIACKGLQRIQISAKSLQYFKFDTQPPDQYEFFTEQPNQCEIDIKQCELIRHVHLHHSNIDDKWIEENLWKLSWLEDLSIGSCRLLKKVKLPNERIKTLRLYNCSHLEEVEISSSFLESYMFSAWFFPRHKFLHSHKVRATLCLSGSRYKLDRFRDFLAGFHLCEELTITWCTIKYWDFPRSEREITSYPSYPLKHLRITYFECPTRNVDLMNKLLWIAKRPKKVSLVFKSGETTSVEFQYSDVALEGDNRRCCRGIPIKCWKHSLITVKLKNMKVDRRRMRVVLNYFIKNAPTLRTIYVDSNVFQVIEGKLDNKYDQTVL